MAKEMQVVSWDDIHLAHGQKVTAEWIDVEVQFGDLKGVLDLTSEHYEQARAAFEDLFGAVFTRESREPSAPSDDVPALHRKKPNPVSPVDKLCPYPARTDERRSYLFGCRVWADSAGRGHEYRPPPGSDKGQNEYHYPKALLEDYNAFLSEEAKKASKQAS